MLNVPFVPPPDYRWIRVDDHINCGSDFSIRAIYRSDDAVLILIRTTQKKRN